MSRRVDPLGDRSEEENFGTRLRAIPVIALGLLGLVVMEALVSASALAVNFTTSDQHFKIYSNYVQGVYGAGFMATNNGTGPTDDVGAAQLGFKTAKLAGLCLITTQDIGPIGTTSLIITGGVPVRASFDHTQLDLRDDNGDPILLDAAGQLTGSSLTKAVDVSDMYLASDVVLAYGNKLAGMNVGQSAPGAAASAGLSWATTNGGTAPQPSQGGLMAERMNLAQLDGGSFGIEMAGGMKLPGLRVRSIKGVATQADCAP